MIATIKAIKLTICQNCVQPNIITKSTVPSMISKGEYFFDCTNSKIFFAQAKSMKHTKSLIWLHLQTLSAHPNHYEPFKHMLKSFTWHFLIDLGKTKKLSKFYLHTPCNNAHLIQNITHALSVDLCSFHPNNSTPFPKTSFSKRCSPLPIWIQHLQEFFHVCVRKWTFK